MSVFCGKKDEKPRQFTFFLSEDDPKVRKMIVAKGHKICLSEDGDWNVALFTGGPDICPILYGENMNPNTFLKVQRDIREIALYKSIHPKRLKVGICRGAQLLNVMAGGRLWQHVNNHQLQGTHRVKFTDTTEHFDMTSRHHQMMIPAPNAWVIASAMAATHFESESMGTVEFTLEERKKTGYTDVEVCYYADRNSLCWQGHPEDKEGVEQDEFFDWINVVYSEADYKASCME